LGVTQELVWTQRLEEKSFASAGDRTPVAWLFQVQNPTLLMIKEESERCSAMKIRIQQLKTLFM
jgi:hypothetical protein